MSDARDVAGARTGAELLDLREVGASPVESARPGVVDGDTAADVPASSSPSRRQRSWPPTQQPCGVAVVPRVEAPPARRAEALPA